MVSVLALSVVDSGFEPGRVKPKTIYNIGICCFSAKHTALRRKSKDMKSKFTVIFETKTNVSPLNAV
jgi:hypothetical protein